MKKTAMTVEEAKAKVNSLMGKPVKIAVSKGRKKTEKYVAVITNVFPCVFTLAVENYTLCPVMSYSYSDVICGNIKFKD